MKNSHYLYGVKDIYMGFYKNINNDRKVRARVMSHEVYQFWKSLRDKYSHPLQTRNVRIYRVDKVITGDTETRNIDTLFCGPYTPGDDSFMTKEELEYVGNDTERYYMFILERLLEDERFALEISDFNQSFSVIKRYELL